MTQDIIARKVLEKGGGGGVQGGKGSSTGNHKENDQQKCTCAQLRCIPSHFTADSRKTIVPREEKIMHQLAILLLNHSNEKMVLLKILVVDKNK